MNWDNIVGFSKSEFAPKDPFIGEKWDMDYNLVLTLHNLREAANVEAVNPIRFIIRINGGFALIGHGEKSLHGRYELADPSGVPADPYERLGRAADFTIEEKFPYDISVFENGWTPWSWLKQAAFVYGKIGPEHGLGIYPWWHRPGLHLDWRAENHERTPAVWTRTPDDEYIFQPFDLFYDLVDMILKWKEKPPERWKSLGGRG